MRLEFGATMHVVLELSRNVGAPCCHRDWCPDSGGMSAMTTAWNDNLDNNLP